jgi:diguanylate cyclase (GGDEF)-like protein/PAS domain S-box-containing protein/putative nucleotidyltransferase with HDIG domain
MKKHINTMSIKSTITSAFLLILLLTTIVLSVIVFSTWTRTANQTSTYFAQKTNEEAQHEIHKFMEVPYHINDANRRFLEEGLINLNDPVQRERFFVGIIELHPADIYSVGYATVDGYYYGARLNLNGEIEIMRNDVTTNGKIEYYSINEENVADELVLVSETYDPRTREWYQLAETSGEPISTSAYKHFMLNELTISFSWPIYDQDGNLEGVLGTHVILTKIDRFLVNLVKNIDGHVIIIEKDTENLISNSFGISNYTITAGQPVTRLNINDLQERSIVQAYQNYLQTQKTDFKWRSVGETIYVNIKEIEIDYINWIVITAVPESLFLGTIYKTLNVSVLVVLIIISGSVMIYYASINKLFSPFDDLMAISESFASGDLSKRIVIKRDDEIGKIAQAFNYMANQINSHVNLLEDTVKSRTLDLENAYHEIRQSQDRLRLILDSTAEGIFGIDIAGNCTFSNFNCLKMLGYDHPAELVGKNMHNLIHHHKIDGTVFMKEDCYIQKALQKGDGYASNEEVFYKKDGNPLHVRYASHPQYKNGKIVGAVISFFDYTENKRSEEEIIYLSYHDYLTGLYNRRFFVAEFEKQDTPESYPLGLMMVDLNALKLINDAFGHQSGDEALILVSRILEKSVSEKDVVARLSGDEFAIILPNTSEEKMELTRDRIKTELSINEIEGIQVTVSIGFECKSNPDVTLDELLKYAENHMYRNKISEGLRLKNNAIHEILNTLIEKHPYENEHSENVSQFCERMGHAMNLKQEDIRVLAIAGMYHDIGKISIPDEILDKPGKLTESEYEIVKKHTEVGYRILRSADEYSDFALFALSHHERMDGKGYPRGLKGKDIPLFSRIIAVANAYDNMTCSRPYREKITKEEAIAELTKCSDTQFDSDIVKLFIKKVLNNNHK